MGACASKTPGQKHIENNSSLQSSTLSQKIYSRNQSRKVSSIHEVRINISDFVQGKKNCNVKSDYQFEFIDVKKGGFGQVCFAKHRLTGAIRAIKIINISNKTLEEKANIVDEIQILKYLDHPHIVKVYEFYEGQQELYIVMEACKGGDLHSKINQQGKLKESVVATIMYQLLQALVYSHAQKIVHRDIKSENVLFDIKGEKGIIKIADWGASYILNPDEQMTQRIGTSFYFAPEVLKHSYNEKCDIWSAGVLMYFMLSGTYPFEGFNDKETKNLISKGKFNFLDKSFDDVTEQAKSLLTKMLTMSVSQRVSASQALCDQWFADQGCLTNNIITENILTNLYNFKAPSKLQQVLWVFIVNLIGSEIEKSHLINAFKAMDLDNDGKLSKEELSIGMKSLNLSNQEIEQLFINIDFNQSAAIDYSEFITAGVDKNKILNEAIIKQIFKIFDKNEKGVILIEDLQKVLIGGSIDNLEDVWDLLARELDENLNGEITYNQFKDLLQMKPQKKKNISQFSGQQTIDFKFAFN